MTTSITTISKADVKILTFPFNNQQLIVNAEATFTDSSLFDTTVAYDLTDPVSSPCGELRFFDMQNTPTIADATFDQLLDGSRKGYMSFPTDPSITIGLPIEFQM